MGWRKTHDLAVVTGSYMKDGESKNRYENVGQVLVGDDGNEMLMMKRSFNPAGVPFKEGGDMIIVNRFEVRDREQAPARQAPPAPRSTGAAAVQPIPSPMDPDDIPF
ncbi:MAG TPA: hypothetical protein VFH85_07945 [Gammaproteobacteria bacterium]|nr:hypothetical protein [Gammaproteobacteria bacterium]